MKSLGTMEPQEVVEYVGKCVKHFERWSGKFRTEARDAFDFAVGRQMPAKDEEYLREQNRPVVTFNRILKFVDAVAGTEIVNKMGVQYVVGGIEDNGAVDLLGNVVRIRSAEDGEAETSAGFHDDVVCGMGWTNTRIDYVECMEGTIVETHIDPLMMGWDFHSRKRNLSDAKWVYEVKRYDDDELKQEFDFDASDLPTGGPISSIDSRPASLMDRGEYDFDDVDDVDADSFGPNRHKVYIFQKMEVVERVVYVDPATGQSGVMDPDKFATSQRRAMQLGLPPVTAYARRKQRTCFEAVVCGGALLKPVEEIYLRSYEPMTGKWDRNLAMYFGAVRVAKDPQLWENKFFSNILHNMSSAGKGVVVEESAVAPNDKRAFERDWSRPDKMKWVRDGAVSQGKIRPPDPTPLPAGLGDMLQFSVSAVPDVLGLSAEFMGLAARTQSGVVERSRRRSGIAVLGEFFQARREHVKRTGRIKMMLALKYFPDSVFLRVGGQEAVAVLPQLRAADFADYDVKVDEAPVSPDQKADVWADVMQMLPVMGPMLDRELWGLILSYSPWPASFVDKLQKKLTAPNPGAQQAQQLEMAQKKADVQETQSKAALNVAKTRAEGQPDIGGLLETLAASRNNEQEAEMQRFGAAAKMRQTMMDTQHKAAKNLMDLEKVRAVNEIQQQKARANAGHR